MTGSREHIIKNTWKGAALKASGLEGRVEWECPSNIALIKYWGKRPGQLPINPSMSISLTRSVSRLSVDYGISGKEPDFSMAYLYNGKPNQLFADRFMDYLQRASAYLPFISSMNFTIRSENSFPHSTGIASSSSSFGALALALCTIAREITHAPAEDSEFYRHASFLARLGSGSAARSVFGGFVLWGKTPVVPGSSDETAIQLTQQVSQVFRDYCDSILVVHSDPKPVSSSVGHRLMDKHPYKAARIRQAKSNLGRLLQALKEGDQHIFVEIIENEALTLHSLMLSSTPGFILLKPGTIAIIEKVREYRKETRIPVGFTLDAGANVHLLYPSSFRASIKVFIEDHLKKYCENSQVIHDQAGTGPVRIS